MSAEVLGCDPARAVYFGDHITSDVVVPRKRSPWQAVAVVVEALPASFDRGPLGADCDGAPGGAPGEGALWGSFFECKGVGGEGAGLRSYLGACAEDFALEVVADIADLGMCVRATGAGGDGV
jgi:hypothetical protein